MILAEAVALALLLTLATGGSLRRLQDEPLRGEWVLLALLPLQVAWPGIAKRLGIPCSLSVILWLLMMATLAVVCFLNAPRRWQLAVAGLGIALNVLVIGVNGAMPVSIKASSEIGVSRADARAAFETDCLHEELAESSNLGVLADIVPIPGPRWQAGVISVGDALLAFGLAGWVFVSARKGVRLD